MGMLSFLKDAGEKLFHSPARTSAPAQPAQAGAASGTQPAAASTAASPAAQPAPDIPALEKTAAEAIKHYIDTQNLKADNLQVAFDAKTATVTVSGEAPDQQTREKIVLCCGNVRSVEHVDDRMTVAQQATPASQWHNVVSGDTLSKIAKEYYGDANKYRLIFDANRPMLSDPDKIYPGQKLRIPQEA